MAEAQHVMVNQIGANDSESASSIKSYMIGWVGNGVFKTRIASLGFRGEPSLLNY